MEQEARIIDAWKRIVGLRHDRWASASQQERLAALQQAENEAARIQGRDPLPVVVNHQADEQEYGYYDGNAIHIGGDSLDNDDVSEVVNTIEHPGFHPNEDEVWMWVENVRPGNYIKFEDDPEGHDTQPVEADARFFGDRIASGVYGDGKG